MKCDWQEATEIKAVGDVFSKNGELSESDEEFFDILCENSIGFFLSKKYGVTPKIGDKVQLKWPLGMTVSGIKINDQIIYDLNEKELEERHEQSRQKTLEKQKKEFEKNKENMDADYDALPEIFKKRIDRLRKNNPDFRWQCEAYDVFACKEAIKIAEVIKTTEELSEFAKYSYEKQTELVKLDYNHSGGTFGQAMQLAHCLIDKKEQYIPYVHSSLAQIGGCESVGCYPPTEEERKELGMEDA